MLALSRASTFCASSTNPLLPLSPTVLTKKSELSATFSSLISAVEPLMSPFSQSKTEFSRSSQPLETLISAEKTLITAWLTTLFKNSSEKIRKTFLETNALLDVLEPPVSERSEPSLPLPRPLSKSTLFLKVKLILIIILLIINININ